jgi:hypothetical protein
MKLKNFIENIILLLILLVIIQTFCDELAVLLNWNVKTRNILTISGLFFDLIFTIEFFTRLIIASRKNQAYNYFFYERGWVDFIASVPLLILNSGPSTYILLFGSAGINVTAGALNILKIVKAIRITRVLRLIRILKIFGKIKNANSVMAQRHIATIATTVCASMLGIIMILGIFNFPGFNESGDSRVNIYRNQIRGYAAMSSRWGNVSLFEQMKTGMQNDPNVLRIEAGGEFYNRYNEAYLHEHFNYEDVNELTVGQIKITLSMKDIRKIESKVTILYFAIIVFTIFSLMVFYSRHFVQTVTDVIHVINKGMSEPDYLLEAKIKLQFKTDDIFTLAEKYNTVWLTLKDKHKKELYNIADKEDAVSVDDLFH